jgi:hypothetical protein
MTPELYVSPDPALLGLYASHCEVPMFHLYSVCVTRLYRQCAQKEQGAVASSVVCSIIEEERMVWACRLAPRPVAIKSENINILMIF